MSLLATTYLSLVTRSTKTKYLLRATDEAEMIHTYSSSSSSSSNQPVIPWYTGQYSSISRRRWGVIIWRVIHELRMNIVRHLPHLSRELFSFSIPIHFNSCRNNLLWNSVPRSGSSCYGAPNPLIRIITAQATVGAVWFFQGMALPTLRQMSSWQMCREYDSDCNTAKIFKHN